GTLRVSQPILSREPEQSPAQGSKRVLSQKVPPHRPGFQMTLAVVLDAQARIYVREIQTRYTGAGLVPYLMLQHWGWQTGSSQHQPETSLHGGLSSDRCEADHPGYAAHTVPRLSSINCVGGDLLERQAPMHQQRVHSHHGVPQRAPASHVEASSHRAGCSNSHSRDDVTRAKL